MAKCKINVSLNNVKIKGEEHLKVFLLIDQLEVAIQIFFFLNSGNAELEYLLSKELWVVLLILKCFLTQND